MIKPFFVGITVLAVLLNCASLLLAFHPTLTSPAMQQTGVNWLAAQAFVNCGLLIFATAHVLNVDESYLSYNRYVKNRHFAPLASFALLVCTAFVLFQSYEALAVNQLIRTPKDMNLFDYVSLIFLLLSASLLLLTSMTGAALTYKSHKTWRPLFEMRKS
jgi:hypothetical protein